MAKASNSSSFKVSPLTFEELPFDNGPWVIPINKPAGITSYDVIRKFKRPLFSLLGKGKGRRKLKIGHFGTLDPFAEGLLLLGTGKALKLVQYFQNEMTKTYEGIGTFEFSTDTGDCEGQRIEVDWNADTKNDFSEEELNKACMNFVGAYQQVPPYFSAVKHEGRPLYKWAREGVFINKDPVERHIYSFEILEKLTGGQYRFRTEVSSGTYVRGLWSDLAHKLKLPGHLTALSRVAWGACSFTESLNPEIENLEYKDLKLACEFWDINYLEINEDQSEKFCRGVYIPAVELKGELQTYQWVLNQEKQLLGLGVPIKIDGNKFLKVEVNLT